MKCFFPLTPHPGASAHKLCFKAFLSPVTPRVSQAVRAALTPSHYLPAITEIPSAAHPVALHHIPTDSDQHFDRNSEENWV